ncbi:MAG: DNA-directed RNA polymerase subunit omega [Verrucomicrobiales bacterium]|nr:DNA-directed RNA polymerase subunit omega [Verrucomicrobiales bacterium]
MDSELCLKAAEKIGNPNLLINLVSRRVRQLNSGGGGASRPLVEWTATLGAADVTLREILEDKITFEFDEPLEDPASPAKGGRKKRKST